MLTSKATKENRMLRLKTWFVSYGALAALILSAVAGKKWK
jgi:hypothetical protein